MTSFAPGVSPWLSGKGGAPSPAQHSPPRAESSSVLSTREVQVDGNSLSTTALGSNTRPKGCAPQWGRVLRWVGAAVHVSYKV